MAKNILFDFGNKKAKGGAKGIADATRAFKRAGADVVTTDIPEKTFRTSGVSYRKIFLTFADSQQIELWVKLTGDIFKVKLGGAGRSKEIPIKDQDNHQKAISEMVKAMDSGRKAFQKKLAKTKVDIPVGMKVTRVKKEVALQEKDTALDEAIVAAEEELEKLKAPAKPPENVEEKRTERHKVGDVGFGLIPLANGMFLAMTKTVSRRFKTEWGAIRFLKRNGFDEFGNEITLDSVGETVNAEFSEGEVVNLYGQSDPMIIVATAVGVVDCQIKGTDIIDRFETDDLERWCT